MKRSLDCGRTWTDTTVLAENGTGDAHNPTAVVVPGPCRRSTVWLLYNQRGAYEPKIFEPDCGAGMGFPGNPGSAETLDAPIDPGFEPGTATLWVRTSADGGSIGLDIRFVRFNLDYLHSLCGVP